MCVCLCVFVCVFVCVCPPPRLLIISDMMWCDMDTRECMNSGLDYWNGGKVDWSISARYFSCCMYFVVCGKSFYTFHIAASPEF